MTDLKEWRPVTGKELTLYAPMQILIREQTLMSGLLVETGSKTNRRRRQRCSP